MNYEIVPARLIHVGPIASRMPEASARVVARGGKPRVWLRWYLDQSSESWVALVDGVPLLMWGFMGSALSTECILWANFTEDVRRYRLTIVREARREIERAIETKHAILGLVAAPDARACRFARFLGFEVREHEIINDNGLICHPIRMVRRG